MKAASHEPTNERERQYVLAVMQALKPDGGIDLHEIERGCPDPTGWHIEGPRREGLQRWVTVESVYMGGSNVHAPFAEQHQARRDALENLVVAAVERDIEEWALGRLLDRDLPCDMGPVRRYIAEHGIQEHVRSYPEEAVSLAYALGVISREEVQ